MVEDAGGQQGQSVSVGGQGVNVKFRKLQVSEPRWRCLGWGRLVAGCALA
jgi:hypothetical protein